MTTSSLPPIASNREIWTEAEITFNKFYVMKMLGEAVDKTRRAEAKARPELKGSRYVWLKNEANLSAEGRDTLATLSQLHLKAARAYQLRCAFQEVYAHPRAAGPS